MTTLVVSDVEIQKFEDVSDWLTSLDASYGRAKRAGWEFLFTLRDGIDQFGRTDHRKSELYELAGQQLGLSPRTLQDYVTTTRKPSTATAISLDLEMGHAAAVLGLENEVAEYVLTEAAENGMSVNATRKLAWEYKSPVVLDVQQSSCATNIAEKLSSPDRDEELIPISELPDYDGDKWYTPAKHIEAVRRVLGQIDLDPASCPEAQEIVKAKAYFTKEANGLTERWWGKVWLNPPYSRIIEQFVPKLIDEYDTGNISEAIALTNNSSDTDWFHQLLERFPACFTLRRVQFWRPNHEVFATRQGQTFFYLGGNVQKFCTEFASFGQVVAKI